MSKIDLMNESWEKQVLGLRYTAGLQHELLEAHKRRVLLETRNRIIDTASVAVLDRRRRLKGIGFNLPNDLILDNFGTWLSYVFRTPVVSVTVSTFSMVDVTNTSRSFNAYNSLVACWNADNNDAMGTRMQFGGNVAAPTRADYIIGTAFGTAPESGRFPTTQGSYAAGTVSVAGAISAGGADTVDELGMYGVWSDTGGTQREIMLFHDSISPGVDFIAGDILVGSYAIAL